MKYHTLKAQKLEELYEILQELSKNADLHSKRPELIRTACQYLEAIGLEVTTSEHWRDIIRAAFAQIPLIIWVVDKEGVLQLAEGGFLKSMGLSPADLVGKCHFELYKDRPDLIQDVKRALAGETFRIDQRMDPFDFEVFFAPVRDDKGEVIQMVGVTVDITERKRLEKELKDAIELRDMFVGIASHELKSPLATMEMQIALKLEDLAETNAPNELEEWRLMHRQVSLLTRLVDDLLDASRIKAGKLDLTLKPTDLARPIQHAIDRFFPQFHAIGQKLQFSLEDGIMADVDELRVEQVMNNLLSNAIRYAPHGPVSIHLRAIDKKRASIIVQDQGPGISPEERDKIFYKFERGKKNNHKGGLGLGLYITRSIIEAHGGSISVDSEGRGAAFRIVLPLDKREE